MNENIDLTKILKDCPIGWKFYSSVYGDVEFVETYRKPVLRNPRPREDEWLGQEIHDSEHPIRFWTTNGFEYSVSSRGEMIKGCGECTFFPSRDQRDWSKFTAPWYKKETCTIDRLKKQGEQAQPQINERAWLHLVSDVLTWKDGIWQYLDDLKVQELAKKLCSKYSQKLYNPSNTENDKFSSNKIEPKFKVGDWIISSVLGTARIIDVNDSNEYQLEYINSKQKFSSIDYVNYEYDKWTIQDAKDGDVILLGTVTAIFKKYIGQEKCICYCSFCKDGSFEIPIENGEDNIYGCYNATPTTKEQRDSFMKVMNDAGYKWDIEKKELKKLIPNRFDPKTLNPFDKVLVRDHNDETWSCDFFSHIREVVVYKFATITSSYKQCVPYNDNTKHLVGTTEEAPKYYRYWED